jgi:hypothetical protein
MTTLARLGKELDSAERENFRAWKAYYIIYFLSPDAISLEEYTRIKTRYQDAERAYGDAVTERSHAVQEKFRNRKTPVRADDEFKLYDAKWMAEEKLDRIIVCRPDLATRREFIDANAKFIEAEDAYFFAKEKFQSDDRQARADRASNIVRKSYHRKPQEVHL